MPLYTKTVQTTAQQAETDATLSTVEVEELIITSVSVFIDEGSNGEVDVIIRDGESRVIPEEEGDPISKPGETGPVPLDHALPGVPSVVEVRAWAPNADFAHEVIVQIETAEAGRANPLQRIAQAFRGGGTVRDASQPPTEQ